MKCNVCGCDFPPVIDKHYVSRDCCTTGVATVFRNDEVKIYDTFDCPNCGCQVIAQERKRPNFLQVVGTLDADEEDENEQC